MSLHATWILWFLGTVLSFGALEAYAIITHQNALSASIRDLTGAWPVLPLIFGVFFLGLGIHFWAK